MAVFELDLFRPADDTARQCAEHLQDAICYPECEEVGIIVSPTGSRPVAQYLDEEDNQNGYKEQSEP